MEKPRLVTIDYLIVFLMIFVIMGHCMFSFAPPWYQSLHAWIYSFHMGAFYFVMGILVKYNYKELNSWKEYRTYIFKRLKKFGFPFVILGTLLISFFIIRIKGTFDDFLMEIKWLFLAPISSKVQYLWFIYILMMFYILTPLFCQFYKYTVLLAVLIGGYLFYFPLGRLFSMHMFSKYFIFFLLGIIICTNLERVKKIPVAIAGGCFVLFIGFAFVKITSVTGMLLYTLLSLPALFFIVFCFSKIQLWDKKIEMISGYCFDIYLYQMIFLHILALLFEYFSVTTCIFILFLLIGVVISITCSIFCAKTINMVRIVLEEKICKR